MDILKQIAHEILEHVDDGDRVVLAPCCETRRETYRCMPARAEFWTLYVYGMALEDLVSAEAAVAVLGAIWDERKIEIDFDFGSDGYSAPTLAEALRQLRLLEGAHPTSDADTAEMVSGLAPLREALTRATSNHGRMEIAARLASRHDILCNHDRDNLGDATTLDTRFAIFSEDGNTLVAAWLPEAPQRVLVAIKSWDRGASRLLRYSEAVELADAIDEQRHVCFDKSEAQFELRATRTNRGEPYRDGIQIGVGDHSIFLEEGYECEDLVKLLRPR